MRRPSLLTVMLLAGGLLLGMGQSASRSLDWDALAAKLIERMALEPGERVLLIAQAGDFEPLVARLRARLTAAGAIDLGAISVGAEGPGGWSSDFTRRARGQSVDAMADLFANVDLAVMLPGATPAHRPYAAMQQLLHRQHGRTIHFHWAGAYSLDGALLGDSPAIDAAYQEALLATDYAGLHAAQAHFIEAMRGQVTRVTTPSGTDLSFEVGPRPATLQDGDASAQRARAAPVLIGREIELPAGAIRIAPVETSVNGKIAFPDASWGGQPVQDLVLTFESGKVVDIAAAAGRDAVVAELEEAGVAGHSFREFALGFNPLLAVPESGELWIPYYGYGAGVVRLSLGDNSELGGQVSGGYVRWNFFIDASVTVGDVVWVRDGRLIGR